MLDFDTLYAEGHEEVVFFSDPSCNLKAIVAIHDTTLGPALGGTRMWPYKSTDDAVTDVLRLSKGMTYKASISGLNLGGGKAVIMGDPKVDKTEALLRSYGRFIESLNGRYITAEDVNMGVPDMEHIFSETSYVVGVAKSHGGSGNPSPYTAKGVFRGMEAACTKAFGNRSLEGKVVALQGVGSVGRHLGEILHNSGAKIFFSDISKSNVDLFKQTVPSAEQVSKDEIYDVKCDIYAPCALGASINDSTIERLKCKVICGAANNQLAGPNHGDVLREKEIFYAPDYLVNAGGLMNVSIEFEGWSDFKAMRMIDTIYETAMEVFKISEEKDIAIHKATDILAESRIASIKKIQGSYLGQVSPRLPWVKKRDLV